MAVFWRKIVQVIDIIEKMVPLVGLEPTRLAALDFESSASTNSTTGAL